MPQLQITIIMLGYFGTLTYNLELENKYINKPRPELIKCTTLNPQSLWKAKVLPQAGM